MEEYYCQLETVGDALKPSPLCTCTSMRHDAHEHHFAPVLISIDSNSIVYVTEDNNHCVSMFTREGQFLRSFGTKGEGPGQFDDPSGMAVDRDGLVYVSDTRNNHIQICRMMPSFDSIV